MDFHNRQNTVDIFSTFVKFDATRFSGWSKDGSLDRNIRRVLSESPEEQENEYWAIYWYKKLLSHNFARGHLYAYLQEACYNAALKIKTRFTVSEYSLPEYFQLAISCADKVLQGFNPERSSNLAGYAYFKFQNLIKDGLIKSGLPDACIRSDWSLLQNCSEKLLRKSLQQQGINTDIERYILAFSCFKAIYVPQQPRGNRQMSVPDAATWNAITQAYNQNNSQLSQPTCNPDTLQKWMQICIKAIRNYMAPPVSSLNIPLSEEGNTLQDNLQSTTPTPFEQILDSEQAQTRRALMLQVNDILSKSIVSLDTDLQSILTMYYGEGLTQTEIAQKLQISQATVSRRLTKINKVKTQWLCNLGEWSKQTLNISITPDVLNNMSALLDEWLEHHYTQTNVL
jgi:RNA polymerase sigma factor (sigma-70 family)